MINASKRGHPIHLRSVVHQPPPGVPQVAHRVQDETEENINTDANNSNNDSVTSYSASIAYDTSLSKLSSSLLDPHQHEVARARKAHLNDEVNNSYK